MKAFIRTRKVGSHPTTTAVTPTYEATDELYRVAREHSGRTTQAVEVVAAEGGDREPGYVLRRYRNGEKVEGWRVEA